MTVHTASTGSFLPSMKATDKQGMFIWEFSPERCHATSFYELAKRDKLKVNGQLLIFSKGAV